MSLLRKKCLVGMLSGLLVLQIAVLGNAQIEQLSSSSRESLGSRESSDSHVNLDVDGNKKRSLLLRMTEDLHAPYQQQTGQAQSRQVKSHGIQKSRHVSDDESQLTTSRRITHGLRQTRSTMEQKAGTVDPERLEVVKQRSQRVSNFNTSKLERRSTRNPRGRITSKSRSLQNRNQQIKRQTLTDPQGRPLVSVLESRNIRPVQQSPIEVPTTRIENHSVLSDRNKGDQAQLEQGRQRRPREILLGDAPGEIPVSQSVGHRQRTSPRNVFEFRKSNEPQTEERQTQPLPVMIAKREAVFENFGDRQRRQDNLNQISHPRLRFERPSHQDESKYQDPPKRRLPRSLSQSPISNSPNPLNQKTEMELSQEDLNQLEMESEEIESPLINPEQPDLARPSDLWLNQRSRYNLSKIKQKSRDEDTRSMTETVDPERLKGIQMSFGDQQNQLQDELQADDLPLESLEPTVTEELKTDGAGDLDFTTGQSELSPDGIEAEAGEPIDAEQLKLRETYRQELHRGLSLVPVQRVLEYLDDDQQTVPASLEQKHYLVDFGGYYFNGINGNRLRTDSSGADWGASFGIWASPNLCYKALYYEDVNLERFGARFPMFQPAISAVHFFGSTVRLPYMMALDPLHECQFSAGFARPGNQHCYQMERMVWSPRAGTFQALLVTAAVFALP